MKTTYTIKPLKWRKHGTTPGEAWHTASSLAGSFGIYAGSRKGSWAASFQGRVIYGGPSVEAAKKACERAYQRELKRALLPVKKD